MPTVYTEIEIAASPEKVRETFLAFENYSAWSKTWFQHIKVTKGNPRDIKPNDELSVAIPSATFKPVVLKNDPTEFIWRGSIPYIFSGDHSFTFQPSIVSPGGTTFIHKEVFTGLLAFVTSLMGDGTNKGFEGFNQELKSRVEAGNERTVRT